MKVKSSRQTSAIVNAVPAPIQLKPEKWWENVDKPDTLMCMDSGCSASMSPSKKQLTNYTNFTHKELAETAKDGDTLTLCGRGDL